ncbi:hypothetical protein PG995_003326 [Apiospora arundinis]
MKRQQQQGPFRGDDQPGLELDRRADTEGLQFYGDYYDDRDTEKQVFRPDSTAKEAVSEHGHYSAGYGSASSTTASPVSPPGPLAPLAPIANEHPRIVPSHDSTQEKEVATEEPTKKWRWRPWWIVLGVAGVLALIAIIVGAVVGTRASKSHGDNEKSNVTGSALKNIRQGSRLAVTGWRDGSSYRIRLFYQDPDDRLRYSEYSGTDSAWNHKSTLLDSLPYKPAVNTSLAASTMVNGNDKDGEYKLWYVDDDNTVRLQIFPRGNRNEQGERGNFNDYPLKSAATSPLAAYWPYLASQDNDGRVRWTRCWGASPDHAFWENRTSGILASPDSGIAVVPALAQNKDAGGFIYRREDMKLSTYLPEHKGNNSGTAWADGDMPSDVPSNSRVPPESPIAAFTVARAGDNAGNGLVDTYVLYAGWKGRINAYWLADSKGWQGPKRYAAFDAAANGTDLTCLTPADRLTADPGMSRCYFQADGGAVHEVQFDGGDWKDLGPLPID